MSTEARTDSDSIFSYLVAAHLKLPAEKGTYYRLAYLREKIVSTLIGSYMWVGTRDMVVDGLTKGRADRTPLAAIMSGSYILNHVCHEYKEPSTTITGQYMQREAVVASSPRRPDASAASEETEEYFIHEVYVTRNWQQNGGNAVVAPSPRLTLHYSRPSRAYRPIMTQQSLSH